MGSSCFWTKGASKPKSLCLGSGEVGRAWIFSRQVFFNMIFQLSSSPHTLFVEYAEKAS